MKATVLICLTFLAIFSEKYSVRFYELQNARRKTDFARAVLLEAAARTTDLRALPNEEGAP